MNDYDVVYIDDERNALAARRPARPRTHGSSVVVPASRRPTVVHSGGGVQAGGYYPTAPTPPMGYPQGYYPPAFQDPRLMIMPAPSVFGNMTTGELVEAGCDLIAAIMPLPDPPTGQGDVEIDVENLGKYQELLARHGKTAQQLHTLGNLLAKFLRR